MDRSAGSAFPVPRMAGGPELRQMRRNVSLGSSCHGPSRHGLRQMPYVSSSAVSEGTFLECDMREVEGCKLVILILKGQGGLRQTSVAILNIDTNVMNGLKWRLCKAAQQLKIPLIFVCDDGIVIARDDLVRNVEQTLRQLTQRNDLNMSEACPSIAITCGHDVHKVINTMLLLGQRSSSSELPTADFSASAASLHILLPSDATDVPEMLELLEQDGEELCRVLQCPYLTSRGESFETLDRDAFAAEAMALGGAEVRLHHERVLSWRRFDAEEATMPSLRASVFHGEFADDSGLCSSDRDS